jgi:CRP-like cAMP-binding protein
MKNNNSQQLIENIFDCFKKTKFMHATHLLHEGDVCKSLYYICKGAIRIFFIDSTGTEKTSSIITAHNFGTAWTSFIAQQPSREHIEVAENTELLYINYRSFQRRVNSDPCWKDFYLCCLEAAYSNQNRKIEALMTLDAKERYLKLLNGNPTLIGMLSNRALASFLDMREETLSRVKGMK